MPAPAPESEPAIVSARGICPCCRTIGSVVVIAILLAGRERPARCRRYGPLAARKAKRAAPSKGRRASESARGPFAGITQIRCRVRHTLRWRSQPGCTQLPSRQIVRDTPRQIVLAHPYTEL